jgi:hypothetical protein
MPKKRIVRLVQDEVVRRCALERSAIVAGLVSGGTRSSGERHRKLHLAIGDGRAEVLPHPERTSPQLAPMISDPEIERIAVAEAIKYEEARGWVVESVESENRGFDLISRRPHPEDPRTFIGVRFIEVKGRAGVGVVALSENEYRTAQRLKGDYWLYTVFNCATTPELHAIQDPARLDWQPVMTVEHYRLGADRIRSSSAKLTIDLRDFHARRIRVAVLSVVRDG